MVRSIKLYHRQIYGYALHRTKLELMRRSELNDKRRRRCALRTPLPIFLRRCRSSARTISSERRTAVVHQRHNQNTPISSRIIINRKENAATRIADLIIPAVGNNKLRHETVQKFMLYER